MIRLAQNADKEAILALSKEFLEASGAPLPFSSDMASAMFRASLSNPDMVCFVLVEDNIVVGYLAGTCGLHRFSPVKIAEEIVWWVSPSSRCRESLKMLTMFEEWAKSKGCAFAAMIGLGDDPITTALYRRKGYQAQEKHFLKRL